MLPGRMVRERAHRQDFRTIGKDVSYQILGVSGVGAMLSAGNILPAD